MVALCVANCSREDRLEAGGWRRRKKEKNKQEIKGRKNIIYSMLVLRVFEIALTIDYLPENPIIWGDGGSQVRVALNTMLIICLDLSCTVL